MRHCPTHGTSWERFGCVLGASWRCLGVLGRVDSLEIPLKNPLQKHFTIHPKNFKKTPPKPPQSPPTWLQLEIQDEAQIWWPLGASWGVFGVLGRLGSVLEASWGASWGYTKRFRAERFPSSASLPRSQNREPFPLPNPLFFSSFQNPLNISRIPNPLNIFRIL